MITYISLWCTDEKGPVFASMFNPLLTILVAILAYFVLGEKLYLGSIIGAFVVIIGLYLLLWGKEGDQEVHVKTKYKSQCSSVVEVSRPRMQNAANNFIRKEVQIQVERK
ncbi:hypothetical protein RIF29_21455 [Crotalaria pallida]|uniref:WAT1-related protein n=1 Tax=Crotalaria pallida TaxID=3830 RepID=A0AAN9I778_CROPI